MLFQEILTIFSLFSKISKKVEKNHLLKYFFRGKMVRLFCDVPMVKNIGWKKQQNWCFKKIKEIRKLNNDMNNWFLLWFYFFFLRQLFLLGLVFLRPRLKGLRQLFLLVLQPPIITAGLISANYFCWPFIYIYFNIGIWIIHIYIFFFKY